MPCPHPRTTLARRLLTGALLGAALVTLVACEPMTITTPKLFYHDKEFVLANGPDAVVTHDGLVEVVDPILREAFLRPDVNWRDYDEILLEPLQISVDYARLNEKRQHDFGSVAKFELEEEDFETLRGDFHEEMLKGLQRNGSFRIVEEPGRRVLRLSAILIDYQLNAPTEGSRDSQTKTYTAATSTMTVMAEARDSVSGEILLRVADTKTPTGNLQLNVKARNRGDVKYTFQVWSNTFRRRLEVLRKQGVVSVEPKA